MRQLKSLKLAGVFGGTLILALQTISAQQMRPARSLIQQQGVEPVLVSVVEQRDEVIMLRYQLPQPQFEAVAYQSRSGRSAQRCLLGNSDIFSEPGKPEIPSVACNIILPRLRSIAAIEVVAEDVRTLPGVYLLSHGETPHPISSTQVTWMQPDEAVYGADLPYPGKTYELESIQYSHGIAIAMIKLYPLSYRPQSGTVSWFRTFTVKVKTKVDESAGTDVRVRLDMFAKRYPTEENPGALGTYIDGELRGVSATRQTAFSQTFDYLLITSQAIINGTVTPGVKELVAQRELKGLVCKVVSIEEIKQNGTGSTNADKLRNYIKDAYTNGKVKFVTLAGDTGIIPLKTVSATNGGNTDNLPSDMPYQCLDGTAWNNDYQAEVMIGRICGQSETEVSNQIFKILKYETDPLNSPYLTYGLSCGEKLDASTFAKTAMDALETYFSTDWKFDDLNDDASSSWTKATLIQMLNGSKYSLINHFGHCNATYAMKMSNGDETKLTNTNYIFVKSQGCIPGAFDKDCFAERLTTQNKTGGMFSVVMNSRYGWYAPGNPTGGSSHKVHVSFWKACWEQKMNYFSEFNEYSHRTNTNYRWDILESNLFGDAATPFRGKEIPAYVQVLSPNGGEKWEQGRTFSIVWDDNVDDSVKIELLKGSAVQQVLAAKVPSNGTFSWSVPADFTIAADYTIRVSSVKQDTLKDVSDAAFAIELKSNLVLKTPNGGEVLEKGSTVQITWEDNLSGNVKIELYKGANVSEPIIVSTPSSGSYSWTVSDQIKSGTGYTLRVTSIDKSWLNDGSDDSVSIQNPMVKTFPYVQDFEKFDTTETIFREYWEQTDDDDMEWTIWSGATPSKQYGTTGADGDHTTGKGIYLYMEASGSGNPSKKMNMITPVFDFSTLKEPKLSFWAHMLCDTTPVQMGDLYVDICVNGVWTNDVIHLSGDHKDAWFMDSLDLKAHEGKKVQFKFRGITGTSWASDICIDDFRIAGKINQAPQFTSTAVTTAKVGIEYKYPVIATDADNNTLTIASKTLPGWLTLTDKGNGTAELKGTPAAANVGNNSVVLTVSDGVVSNPIEQVFTINVEPNVEIINVVDVHKDLFKIAPNPANRTTDIIQFGFALDNVREARLSVYDAVGNELYSAELHNGSAVWDLPRFTRIGNDQYLAVLWITYSDGTIEQITKPIGVTEK